jgi:mono/diheme cytochrome c family protein
MKTPSTKSHTPLAMLPVAALVLSAGVLGGCRGDREDKPPRQFFPDLDDQQKWHPQGESDFFADGRTMRRPPTGTVPFGRMEVVSDESWAEPFMAERQGFIKEDAALFEGVGPNGENVERIPVAVTLEMVKRGRERFDIYCSACHGYTGDGKGLVGVQLDPVSANLHDDKFKKPPTVAGEARKDTDGHLFRTIRYGVRNVNGDYTMPAYAYAVSEKDAWAIVSYIRALQASREGTLNDVPEKDRQAIEREWGRMTTAPGTAEPVADAGGAK